MSSSGDPPSSDSSIFSSLPAHLKLSILSSLGVSGRSSSLFSQEMFQPEKTFLAPYCQQSACPISFLSPSEFHSLCHFGFVVRDNFLGDSAEISSLLGELEILQSSGQFAPGGMKEQANSEGRWLASSYRSDSIMWLRPDNSPVHFRSFIARIAAFQADLNRGLAFESTGLEVQLAFYPPNGSSYVRHRDDAAKGKKRRLTFIYYLNTAFSPEKGGQLRLFNVKTEATAIPGISACSTAEECFVDVSPLSDRFIIFLSEHVEHEVRPNYQNRFAITTWIT